VSIFIVEWNNYDYYQIILPYLNHNARFFFEIIFHYDFRSAIASGKIKGTLHRGRKRSKDRFLDSSILVATLRILKLNQEEKENSVRILFGAWMIAQKTKPLG
jgi:hypothetical protein